MSAPDPVESISKSEARRIALAAQGFAEARPSGRIDRRHLRRVMSRIQLLQLDAIPVVIRTQYLPLFSRLGAYPTALLDALAYRPRKRRPSRSCDADAACAEDASCAEWFEAWSHEASLLPVELEPWLRWSKARARQGHTWRHLHRLAQRDPAYVASVREEVAARGPLTAAELSDPRPAGRQAASEGRQSWGTRSDGARALGWLFRVGELGVRRRPGFAKEYDLFERVVPESIRQRPTPDFEAALDELLLRAAKAHGVASADCLVDYFRLPVRSAKARLEALAADGALVRCRVEGWERPAYRSLEARCPRGIEACALLSPFDPVVWHRPRIDALFDFEYRVEIYTPEAERRWGYYVLPLLLGESLAARFDLRTDRDAGVLEVRAAHLEPGQGIGAVAPAAARELSELASLVGVDGIRVQKRNNLARAVSREVAAMGL